MLQLLPLLLLAPQGAPPITVEQAGGKGERISFRAELPSTRWAPDGRHVVIGRGDSARWVDPVTGADVAPPEKEGGESAADRGRRIDELRLRGGRGSRGARGAAGEELLAASPDGKLEAFVRSNDLVLRERASKREVRVTSNGGLDQFNGKLDWVYQEEIYGRGNFKAFWWSPASSHVAFLSLDEAPVHEFTVVDHIEDGHFRVKPEVTNYPKVGDPNPNVAVGITDTTGGVAWVDLSRYEGQEILVVRVGWDPSGGRCLVHVQDRIQQWAELLAVDPDSGASTVLLREQSASWTERPEPPRWMADGSFLWRSHRTGRDHLYRYSADGTLLGAVTKGDWNLGRVEHIDEKAGRLWFTATIDGDIDTNLYRADFGGANLVRLTSGRGSHSWSWNDDRTMFIDRVSSLTDPGEARVVDAEGKILRRLAEAEVPGALGRDLGRWELHEVAARDGYLLDVAVQLPAHFDSTRSYPVWVSTYSGPAAPSVRNRWSSSTKNQFLAQEGVIVLQANVRSATSRGHVDTSACYLQLGLKEVEDMADVVRWLTAKPWADALRVGITGYSFGGTMTALSMMRTDLYALGIAGGGVYDWRMYDTIYTERYMATPKTNLEGYDATSCLKAAPNLRGFLHMHHGVMDDNVHVQNMMQLAYALQNAELTNWSMMAYPQTRHGIRDRELRYHAWLTEWRLIQEHLRPGRRAQGS